MAGRRKFPGRGDRPHMKLKKRLRLLLLAIGPLMLSVVALGAENTAAANDFDERPVPVKAVPPVYPPEMLRAGTSGLVSVEVVIDESGNVAERTVIRSSRSEFEKPALDAVRRWKFKPARKSGAAVKARIVLPIQFTFQG